MAVASPFFQSLPLGDHGLEWIHPPATLAHPFDGHVPAAVVTRSLADTAAALGADDRAYRRSIGSVVRNWARLTDVILGPPGLPSHPLAAARFGLAAMQSAERLAERRFARIGRDRCSPAVPRTACCRSTWCRLARSASSSHRAHTHGWPIPARRRAAARRCAGQLPALAGRRDRHRAHGSMRSRICRRRGRSSATSRRGRSCASPAGCCRTAIAGGSSGTATASASYKVDFALDGPVPWSDHTVANAATVHLGGSLTDIATAERVAGKGAFRRGRSCSCRNRACSTPRVRTGRTAHAVDLLPRAARISSRHAAADRAADRALRAGVSRPDPRPPCDDAPGFRAAQPEPRRRRHRHGRPDLRQMLARPTWRWYRTPRRGLYLCSAATPPGVGVHGMCGYHAAQAHFATSFADGEGDTRYVLLLR